MKCPTCDAELLADAAFCHRCGGSLTVAAPTASSPDQASVAARQRLPLPPVAGRGNDDQEELLWQGQFSKLAMIGAWIGGGVFTVALIAVGTLAGFSGAGWLAAVGVIAVVWVGLLLRLFYLQLSLHYYLTSQRFIHEHGLLWRDVDRIETIDIDDVAVQQGPIERMLGIGSIRLRTSDVSTPEFTVQGIEEVRRVASLIDDARRKERRKRGMYVESI